MGSTVPMRDKELNQMSMVFLFTSVFTIFNIIYLSIFGWPEETYNLGFFFAAEDRFGDLIKAGHETYLRASGSANIESGFYSSHYSSVDHVLPVVYLFNYSVGLFVEKVGGQVFYLLPGLLLVWMTIIYHISKNVWFLLLCLASPLIWFAVDRGNIGACFVFTFCLVALSKPKIIFSFWMGILAIFCLTVRPPFIIFFLCLVFTRKLEPKHFVLIVLLTFTCNMISYLLIISIGREEYHLISALQTHFSEYQTSGALNRFNNSVQSFFLLINRLILIDLPIWTAYLVGLGFAVFFVLFSKNSLKKLKGQPSHLAFVLLWLSLFLPNVPNYHWSILLTLICIKDRALPRLVWVGIILLIVPKQYFVLDESIQMILNPVFGVCVLMLLLYVILQEDRRNEKSIDNWLSRLACLRISQKTMR